MVAVVGVFGGVVVWLVGGVVRADLQVLLVGHAGAFEAGVVRGVVSFGG